MRDILAKLKKRTSEIFQALKGAFAQKPWLFGAFVAILFLTVVSCSCAKVRDGVEATATKAASPIASV